MGQNSAEPDSYDTIACVPELAAKKRVTDAFTKGWRRVPAGEVPFPEPPADPFIQTATPTEEPGTPLGHLPVPTGCGPASYTISSTGEWHKFYTKVGRTACAWRPDVTNIRLAPGQPDPERETLCRTCFRSELVAWKHEEVSIKTGDQDYQSDSDSDSDGPDRYEDSSDSDDGRIIVRRRHRNTAMGN